MRNSEAHCGCAAESNLSLSHNMINLCGYGWSCVDSIVEIITVLGAHVGIVMSNGGEGWIGDVFYGCC